MLKLPNLDDLQGRLDAAVAKAGIGEYVEYARYLPKDAPVPDDADFVLAFRSAKGPGLVEVAIRSKGGMVAMLANIGLDLL